MISAGEERLSEKIRNAQIQPDQRGYHVGGYRRVAPSPGVNSYGVKTLTGNWSEEQCDSTYLSGRSLLLPARENRHQSTYAGTIGSICSNQADSVYLRTEALSNRCSGIEFIARQSKLGRPFPSLQLERDAAAADLVSRDGTRGYWLTESRAHFQGLSSGDTVVQTAPRGRKRCGPPQDYDFERTPEGIASYVAKWTKTPPHCAGTITSEHRRSFLPPLSNRMM